MSPRIPWAVRAASEWSGILTHRRKSGLIGTTVELEALWTFSGKNDSQGPIAVGAVSAIAAERFASNPRTSVAGTATASPLKPQDRHIQNDLGATQETFTLPSSRSDTSDIVFVVNGGR